MDKEKRSEGEETTKNAVQSQFSRSAEAYVSSPIHAQGKDLHKLVEIAHPTGTEHVLDIATGGGHVANALAPLVHRVTALDLTEEMLLAARRFLERNGRTNVDFVKGDAETLPFQDGVFDIVTCRIAAHHFPHVASFINEAFRVLKPGGSFLLVDNVVPEEEAFDEFYNELEKRRDYSHHRAWKKSEWVSMTERAGFEIGEWHRFTKTFKFDEWCDRMHLPDEQKQELTYFVMNAPEKVKRKFRIEIQGRQVDTFQGESIVLKAVKPA
jgi:ubiquinone/menaquinone biosynthesis C-methylase UbiE